MLAIGHHLFNNWANGRPVGSSPSVPQVWVFRVGTAFGIAFQTVLAACLGFVICQLLWFSTRRNFLSIQGLFSSLLILKRAIEHPFKPDINTLYLVERRDILSTITSNAIRRAPLLVIVTFSSFLLPIAAVFTPASLAVSDAIHSDVEGPCVITTGNFSGFGAIDLGQGGILLSCFTPTVQKIAEAAFYGGIITPLPAYCGQNCTPMIVATARENNQQPSTKAMQLGALTLATRHLLWGFNSAARAASFLDMGFGDTRQFVWGDVIKGVEQTAANVTASMLNMDLGLQNSTCLYTQTDLIYIYHQPNLWIPYGIALFLETMALIFGVLVFLRYNPDNLTTSFTDTVGITRDHDLDVLARLDGGKVQADTVLHSTKY
ncbi:hypothetical protein FS837_002787, partial [Tulasnella sp. UAMH 9824]